MLFSVARQSIHHGFSHRDALKVNPADYPAELREPGAVFVTLRIETQLRGCIGTMESSASIVSNTAHYAWLSAFKDGRFSPLTQQEESLLEVQISVLSPLEPIEFKNEADLLSQIRPGIDGLLLEDDYYRGTFLPSVWEEVPELNEFWRCLKQKAGMPVHYWSDSVQVKRYTSTCYIDPAKKIPFRQ